MALARCRDSAPGGRASPGQVSFHEMRVIGKSRLAGMKRPSASAHNPFLHVQAKESAAAQDARGLLKIVEDHGLVRHVLKNREG